MRKIGIFGGTFNPIHNGHVQLLTRYLDALDFDEILVIPTQVPPHKLPENLVPAQMRLEMCNLAVKHLKRVQVSDIELLRPGRSYTIDTVNTIKQKFPNGELYLLVGGDMFLEFRKWRDWQKLLNTVILCTASRNFGEYRALLEMAEELSEYGNQTRVFDFDVMPMSSTQIRERLMQKQDCQDFLPKEVYSYILEHHLYGTD